MPLESRVNTWGEEIYFEIPVDMPQEPGVQEILEVGDLGCWPLGQALCIFYGPTPVSTDERPRAYSPVNVLGKILADHGKLKLIQNKEKVRLECFG
ncbi:MAG: cyclophilin-like family protein [Anaerolineales bacterium]